MASGNELSVIKLANDIEGRLTALIRRSWSEDPNFAADLARSLKSTIDYLKGISDAGKTN